MFKPVEGLCGILQRKLHLPYWLRQRVDKLLRYLRKFLLVAALFVKVAKCWRIALGAAFLSAGLTS